MQEPVQNLIRSRAHSIQNSRLMIVAAAFYVACVPIAANASVILTHEGVGGSAITINPSSDGALYTCNGCDVVDDLGYVQTAGGIQGAMKFSTDSLPGLVSNAYLILNAYDQPPWNSHLSIIAYNIYGQPEWGSQVSIYGYGTSDGQLAESDVSAGVFLGTVNVSRYVQDGAEFFLNVTSFVTSTDAPYLAFNLRSADTSIFSSLEYNYGHPSQLLVITDPLDSFAVPEPASAALIVFGLAGIGVTRLYPKGVASKKTFAAS